jgi:hypothetical protein
VQVYYLSTPTPLAISFVLTYTMYMKHEIEIDTGKQKGSVERKFVFKTDEEIPLEYFKTRKSLDVWSFPRYVKGDVEIIKDSSIAYYEWKDLPEEWFDDLKIQNLLSISINGVDINQEITDIASTYGAETKFPMLYQAQFTFDSIPEWVFNWYPNTGTLSKQKRTEKQYSMKSLGNYPTIKEALEACK